MSAIRMHRFGEPKVLKLENVSSPVPKLDEVLVEVRAASVNPVNIKIRRGAFKSFKPRLPAIFGRNIAGMVRAVGPASTAKKEYQSAMRLWHARL